MKIVDACSFYTPFGGGVKTYIDRKLRFAPDMGHDIAVVVPSDRDGVETLGPRARIIHLESPQLIVDRRYRYFDDEAKLHAILDAEAPDIVEASSPWRTASYVANWSGSAPRALIMHADPLSAYPYRWFGGIASREAIDQGFEMFWRHLRRLGVAFDLVVCANEQLAGRLEAGGVAHVAMIRMGVDAGIFSPAHRDPALRRDLLARCDLPEDAHLLIGVGRHSAEKRWPMVIDAVLAAGQVAPVGLVMLGEGRESARLARHVGGNPHVQLLAPVRDRAMLARILASADALIHGCEGETFGMVPAEAAASGLPVIVPDEGGAASIAALGRGFTYSGADSRACADAILDWIGYGSAKTLDEAASLAAHVPTIETHFARLFSRYADLVAAGRPLRPRLGDDPPADAAGLDEAAATVTAGRWLPRF